jgi:hypothetical protein
MNCTIFEIEEFPKRSQTEKYRNDKSDSNMALE